MWFSRAVSVRHSDTSLTVSSSQRGIKSRFAPKTIPPVFHPVCIIWWELMDRNHSQPVGKFFCHKIFARPRLEWVDGGGVPVVRMCPRRGDVNCGVSRTFSGVCVKNCFKSWCTYFSPTVDKTISDLLVWELLKSSTWSNKKKQTIDVARKQKWSSMVSDPEREILNVCSNACGSTENKESGHSLQKIHLLHLFWMRDEVWFDYSDSGSFCWRGWKPEAFDFFVHLSRSFKTNKITEPLKVHEAAFEYYWETNLGFFFFFFFFVHVHSRALNK